MYKLLKQILKELKETNEKLQAIESSKEQENKKFYGTNDWKKEVSNEARCTPN